MLRERGVLQDALLTEIFASIRRIAVVGLSPDPSKKLRCRAIPEPYYEVIPVNPNYEHIEGMQCYPSVASIPGSVDLIDVFQRSERVPDLWTMHLWRVLLISGCSLASVMLLHALNLRPRVYRLSMTFVRR